MIDQQLADRFRSPQMADQFFASYDATLALWPVPHDSLDVQTRFGTTHINAAGSPDSPPLVLIHGAQTSSTAWYANVSALSQHYRVYAPDVVDQAGKSVPVKKLVDRQECADWLTGVLDALKITKASIVGHSHGGWQALNLAITAPDRVDRLVLLSPVGITRLKAEIFLRMLPVFIIPTKRMFYRSFQWSTVKKLNIDQPEPVIDQIMQGGTSFKGNELGLGVLSVFEDNELQRIDKPALLLVGDQEKIFNPKQMLDRARRLMPKIEAEIIANAGHLLPIDQVEAVNARMMAFL
jgi:pimeloyl-ACP methyl ester carboxylesterase